ncbi:DUF4232 domain-containing protein [Streptomyces sp. NPDC046821]|uniref:DUF4232 domain-containing protein n=1 Tax=Streptomyces sp. NPDC046821 TaxID=3154702 RepID=UPI0033D4DD86
MALISAFPRLGRLAAVGAAVALAAGGATAGVAAGATQAPAASSPRTCALGDLYVSMGTKDFGAGQVYWPIKFTNTSTTACSLHGFPGVSVLNTAHQQIGAAATRTGPTHSVTVSPAHTVTAVIHTTNGPLGGPCRPTSTYIRVYPPGSFHSVLVPAALSVCSNDFTITAVGA